MLRQMPEKMGSIIQKSNNKMDLFLALILVVVMDSILTLDYRNRRTTRNYENET